MTRLDEQLDRATSDLLRVSHALPETERIMKLSLPGTKQAAYDTERRGPEVWCDEHEQETHRCHNAGHRCDGVPLSGPQDPTGNDAVSVRVYADLRETRKRLARLQQDADWLVGLVNRYRDADPTPQRDRELETANTPMCERHGRYGHERAARSVKGTRVRREDGSYVFAEAKRLCEFCTDIAVDFGRLPTQQEIEANVNGRRIRRPA